MANGDIAAAAGLPTVPGTMSVRDGYDEINLTRDIIVLRTDDVTPIAKGGTGATTAAGARTNLDAPSTGDLTTGLAGKSNTGHTHSYPSIGVGAINNGGFGASVGNLSCAQINASGSVFAPGVLAPVGSSWTALAAQSADGRIGVQPSAQRFKKNIRTLEYSDERLDAFLDLLDRLYQLRAEIEGNPDGPVNFGWIAEEVIEAGFPELVAFDANGEPFSINYAQAVIPLHAEARRRRDETNALRAELAELRALVTGGAA